AHRDRQHLLELVETDLPLHLPPAARFLRAEWHRCCRDDQRNEEEHHHPLRGIERLELLDDAFGDGTSLRRELTDRGAEVRAKLPARVGEVSDFAHLAERLA